MENLERLQPAQRDHKNLTAAAASDLPVEKNQMQMVEQGVD